MVAGGEPQANQSVLLRTLHDLNTLLGSTECRCLDAESAPSSRHWFYTRLCACKRRLTVTVTAYCGLFATWSGHDVRLAPRISPRSPLIAHTCPMHTPEKYKSTSNSPTAPSSARRIIRFWRSLPGWRTTRLAVVALDLVVYLESLAQISLCQKILGPLVYVNTAVSKVPCFSPRRYNGSK